MNEHERNLASKYVPHTATPKTTSKRICPDDKESECKRRAKPRMYGNRSTISPQSGRVRCVRYHTPLVLEKIGAEIYPRGCYLLIVLIVIIACYSQYTGSLAEAKPIL